MTLSSFWNWSRIAITKAMRPPPGCPIDRWAIARWPAVRRALRTVTCPSVRKDLAVEWDPCRLGGLKWDILRDAESNWNLKRFPTEVFRTVHKKQHETTGACSIMHTVWVCLSYLLTGRDCNRFSYWSLSKDTFLPEQKCDTIAKWFETQGLWRNETASFGPLKTLAFRDYWIYLLGTLKYCTERYI